MRPIKLIRTLLILTLLTLLGIEGLLRLDPLGMIYFPELLETYAQSEAISNGWGWQLTPGVHTFAHWSATVNSDHTRLVPASNPDAPQTWVFLGDSLTFGFSVNDDETFVNHIAERLPDIRVIDAGSIAYSSAQVRDRASEFPDADRLIYLIYDNDAEPRTMLPQVEVKPPTSGINLYIAYWPLFMELRYDRQRTADYIAKLDLPRFCDDLQTLGADPRMTMFIFEESVLLDEAQACASVLTLPRYEPQVVSISDDHPNAAGQRMIAEQMLARLTGS